MKSSRLVPGDSYQNYFDKLDGGKFSYFSILFVRLNELAVDGSGGNGYFPTISQSSNARALREELHLAMTVDCWSVLVGHRYHYPRLMDVTSL